MESNAQIFLNEYSLQGQFHNSADYENAVVAIISMVTMIREKGARNSLYKSATFASHRAMRDQVIYSCFKYISKADIRENFIRIIFDRGALRDWEDQQCHDPGRDDYFYMTEQANLSGCIDKEIFLCRQPSLRSQGAY